jgi:beta-phosphoglucomutase-like phosphatase (HAD superfamily)
MINEVENIIFDFDGVLVDSLDHLFRLHNKFLGPLNEDEFREFFTGNSLSKGHREYGQERMDIFFDK